MRSLNLRSKEIPPDKKEAAPQRTGGGLKYRLTAPPFQSREAFPFPGKPVGRSPWIEIP